MGKAISYFFVSAGALVLALALLLFLQWPLREVLQAYSREANDMAQIIFACYVAVGVTAASLKGVHLTATTPSNGAVNEPRWRALATALCVCPWAFFMLWSCLPAVIRSVASREHFADTLNPGYFVIRVAMVLMLVLIVLACLVRLRTVAAAGAMQGR